MGITRLRARDGERWVYAATGPVANIAARLCALATGRQIFVSGAMVAWVPATCELRVLGPRTLKSVSGTVEVLEVFPCQARRPARGAAAEARVGAPSPHGGPSPRPVTVELPQSPKEPEKVSKSGALPRTNFSPAASGPFLEGR